jgi:putative nucleotidyltransferase with HDIG domain
MKAKLKYQMIKTISHLRSGPAIFSFALYIAVVIVVITSGYGKSLSNLNNFEAGKIADRDVVAGFTISFVDEEATRIRLQAVEGHVPAVFRFLDGMTARLLESWDDFCNLADMVAGNGTDSARITIEAEFPAVFSKGTLDVYFDAPQRTDFRSYGTEALNKVLERGIFSLNANETKHFSPEIAEITGFPQSDARTNFISYNDVISLANAREALGEIIRNMEAPVGFKGIAVDLLRPFVRENVFFSFAESQQRVDEAKAHMAPIVRVVDKGKKIIRKGYLITENEMEELKALHQSSRARDPRSIIGLVLLILLVYMLFVILHGSTILGRTLGNNERFLIASLTGLYIIGSVLLKTFSASFEDFPITLAVPTALFIMIIAVFMGTRTALVMSLALPLVPYLAGAFDNSSYIIALVSGAAASTVIHHAQNRMNLIRAGLIIAAANCAAVVVILLIRAAPLNEYPAMLFWAAMNGIVSGMLILGFLPPLEHALNAVTPFRLLELSDLNAPILRRLFTVAPGTYSHSIMVANLAEQACQDIGANALLARVGAYYHDIGKMENPDYFVENQGEHNRHDDITPRLSATIIRSHVKLGVEKAHSLGLPKDLIAIISEHHGNSVISWFYNKATEREDDVNTEDFSYPGKPPRSKESAVVMLADITEAAVRTLSKPTAGKMEKFINQLFEAKVDHGQLTESELSFRDLENIKKAFVKVLASYYHSRIEYPKQKEEAE